MQSLAVLGEEDKIFLKEVAECLIKLREAKNLSQEDVFNDTGIHIARIELGNRNFSMSTLRKLANYYDVPPASLFRGIK